MVDPKDKLSTLTSMNTLVEDGEERSKEKLARLIVPVPGHLEIPEDLKSERFDTLSDIPPTSDWTYYRPSSRIYAVDALIVELTPDSDEFAGNCYGLRMTMDVKPGIQANGVENIVNWTKTQNYTFVYVLVVPPKLASDYKWKTIQTLKGVEHKKAGNLKEMIQLITAVDHYCMSSLGPSIKP